jgi:hypothetical protein
MRVASAETALAQLRDPSTWSTWQAEIGRAEGPAPLGEGDHVTGDASMLGFAVGGRADVVSADERGIEHDVIVGIRMNVRYTIEPAGDGWVLTHRLTADLPRGLSGRVLSIFLKRRLRRMQQRLLGDLSQSIARSGRSDPPPDPAERSKSVT